MRDVSLVRRHVGRVAAAGAGVADAVQPGRRILRRAAGTVVNQASVTSTTADDDATNSTASATMSSGIGDVMTPLAFMLTPAMATSVSTPVIRCQRKTPT